MKLTTTSKLSVSLATRLCSGYVLDACSKGRAPTLFLLSYFASETRSLKLDLLSCCIIILYHLRGIYTYHNAVSFPPSGRLPNSTIHRIVEQLA